MFEQDDFFLEFGWLYCRELQCCGARHTRCWESGWPWTESMVYLRNGQVVEKRSKLHPAALLDFLWNFFNLIGLFIGTMSAKTPKRRRKKERGFHNYLPGSGDGGDEDGGGGGRRRRGPNIHVTQPPPTCGGGAVAGG